MTQLILATHNDHKAQEFRDILPQYSVQTLADLGDDDDCLLYTSDAADD